MKFKIQNFWVFLSYILLAAKQISQHLFNTFKHFNQFVQYRSLHWIIEISALYPSLFLM